MRLGWASQKCAGRGHERLARIVAGRRRGEWEIGAAGTGRGKIVRRVAGRWHGEWGKGCVGSKGEGVVLSA